MLFLWQFPHFMAIAWIYREDYSRAGYWFFRRERKRPLHVLAGLRASLALIPISLSPAVFGHAGLAYSVVAFALSAGYFFIAPV